MFLDQVSVAGQNVLRVRNWERFAAKGKGGSRVPGRLTAAMLGSVCGLRTLVRRRLLNLPGGAAAYGVWILLSALAAETCVPGVFLDDDHSPLTVEDQWRRIRANRHVVDSDTPSIRNRFCWPT